MNIVLIGYRGTGKSTVGKLLAAKLERSLISTDTEVVRRAGKPIPDLVQEFGWEHFRDLESEVCRELGHKDGLVIDAGGGAILRPGNVEVLKKNGKLFWLTATVETIASRIGGDTQRPSLTGKKSFIEEIADVLAERTPKYEEAADHTISTERQSSEQVADRILACL
jgi:shikimate kinase